MFTIWRCSLYRVYRVWRVYCISLMLPTFLSSAQNGSLNVVFFVWGKKTDPNLHVIKRDPKISIRIKQARAADPNYCSGQEVKPPPPPPSTNFRDDFGTAGDWGRERSRSSLLLFKCGANSLTDFVLVVVVVVVMVTFVIFSIFFVKCHIFSEIYLQYIFWNQHDMGSST